MRQLQQKLGIYLRSHGKEIVWSWSEFKEPTKWQVYGHAGLWSMKRALLDCINNGGWTFMYVSGDKVYLGNYDVLLQRKNERLILSFR